MLPEVLPSSVVLIIAKWSLDSSQIIPLFISSPLSIIKPASSDAEPVAPDDRTINGSFTTTFSLDTVVVFPLTVKLPLTMTLLPVIFPVVVKLLSENEIAPPESEIAPLLMLTFPILADVSADKVAVDTLVAFNSPLLL